MEIITITGVSGAGKDTAARILSEITGIPTLVSYTTRPIREGEKEGREHYFVEKCDVPKSKMLAYTKYGGCEYWTLLPENIDRIIYVIDEAGLVDLTNHHPFIDIKSIYIEASDMVRRSRGVSEERMKRDRTRESLPNSFYNKIIVNNDDMESLRKALRQLVDDGFICESALWERIQAGQWISMKEYKPTLINGFDWVLVQFVEKDSGFVGKPHIAEMRKKFDGTEYWGLDNDDISLENYINVWCYASSWKIIEPSPEWKQFNKQE